MLPGLCATHVQVLHVLDTFPQYSPQLTLRLPTASPLGPLLCGKVADKESLALIRDLDEQAPIDIQVGKAISSLWEGEEGKRTIIFYHINYYRKSVYRYFRHAITTS